MNLNQLAIAAGADTKWLHNSGALLGRTLRPTVANARWWGVVRILQRTFGLTLAAAADGANRALETKNNDGDAIIAEDASSTATMSVNLLRYDSIFLANLSRAFVCETPKQRGRRAERSKDPIARATAYGLDIGLMRSSLARTSAERLAVLEANRTFVHEMQRNRRKR